MSKRLAVLAVVLISCIAVQTFAQPVSCPALVSEALAAVGNACGGLARNQACYGNLSMLATPRDPAKTLTFESPGDKVGVADIVSLQLESLVPDTSEWGIALMSLQANIPDTLPGQNATIVLFGDVEIENRGGARAPTAPVIVTAQTSVKIYAARDTTGQSIGYVGSSRTVGRSADGAWLRVESFDGRHGWVEAALVDVIGGDVALLPEMTDSDPFPSKYGPMQAFRLKTGIGAPSCTEAPASGILIQTPEGAGQVTFEVNKVTMSLGSTAVARTTGDTMRVALLEGKAFVTVAGKYTVIRTGRVGIFELDTNGDATGTFRIEDMAASDAANVPLVLLPRPSMAAKSDMSNFVSGTYRATGPGDYTDCAVPWDNYNMAEVPPWEELHTLPVSMTLNDDGTLVVYLTGYRYTLRQDDAGAWQVVDSDAPIPQMQLSIDGDSISLIVSEPTISFKLNDQVKNCLIVYDLTLAPQ